MSNTLHTSLWVIAAIFLVSVLWAALGLRMKSVAPRTWVWNGVASRYSVGPRLETETNSLIIRIYHVEGEGFRVCFKTPSGGESAGVFFSTLAGAMKYVDEMEENKK